MTKTLIGATVKIVSESQRPHRKIGKVLHFDNIHGYLVHFEGWTDGHGGDIRNTPPHIYGLYKQSLWWIYNRLDMKLLTLGSSEDKYIEICAKVKELQYKFDNRRTAKATVEEDDNEDYREDWGDDDRDDDVEYRYGEGGFASDF
jgi:hypothetical protein